MTPGKSNRQGQGDLATRRIGWMLILVAAGSTMIGWPIAVRFYVPSAIGFVQLPGVVLFVVMAGVCTACFLVCPAHPKLPKLISLILAIHSLFWALDVCGDCWLHCIYQV